MINLLRKNIGTIIAGFGFVLLCIITFGDIGEILTEAYWQSVKENLTSIGFVSISLTMIQVTIKQGVSEQALQKGLNTPNTTEKYKEHRKLIKDNNSRMIYMPYFLQIYNDRHTKIKKREFLVDNNFTSEQTLYQSKKRKLIQKYRKIRIYITSSRIKWATTDIIYNKHGQIQTLAEHRTKRAVRGTILGLIFMVGVTLLAKGLFFEESGIPLIEKFVKLLTYVVIIAVTSILAVIKEYEKGAFGLPNELEEINEIWYEFQRWEIPKWAIDEVESLNRQEVKVDGQIKESKETTDVRTDIQIKPKESEVVKSTGTIDNVDNAWISNVVPVPNVEIFNGERDGSNGRIRQQEVYEGRDSSQL